MSKWPGTLPALIPACPLRNRRGDCQLEGRLSALSVGFAADFYEPIAPCASETKHTSIFNITLMAILSSARRKLLYMIDFLFKQGFVIFAS